MRIQKLPVKRSLFLGNIALFLLAFSFLFPNAALSKEEGISNNIAYQTPGSAEITRVAYYFEEYKGAPRLHMEVTIKNTSEKMKRFRLNIFLPEGPAGGGMYPRKGEGIEAGKDHKRVFPMYFDKLPTGFTLVVKEMKQ
jgi:hypothetical protein